MAGAPKKWTKEAPQHLVPIAIESLRGGNANAVAKGWRVKFPWITEAHVAEITAHAIEKRWVVISQGLVYPEYILDDRLCGDLRGALANYIGDLRALKLLVVSPKDPKQQVATREAHAQAGAALAAVWATPGYFRSGDTIGIGSGRGVYYALRIFAEKAPSRSLNKDNIKVWSLTGSVFLQGTDTSDKDDAEGGIGFSLDADSMTPMVAGRFAGSVHNYPMHCAIAFETARARDAAVKNSGWRKALARSQDPESIHSLAGIGVFGNSHRLYAAVTNKEETSRRPQGEDEDVIKPIAPLLRALADKVDVLAARYPTYFPVADICNRLFVVPPPETVKWIVHKDLGPIPHHGLSTKATVHVSRLRKEDNELILRDDHSREPAAKSIEPGDMSITELVNRINRRLATITKTELLRMNVCLVAASWPKARALLHVMRRFPSMIGTLAIDAGLASEMLQILKGEHRP